MSKIKDGLHRLTNVLSAPAKKAAPPVAASAAPAKTELLLAWQSPLKNPRLLIAYRPDTDPTNPNNLVSVNVRANHNFMRHMRLQVRPVTGQPNVFDLVGPLPRWKGRW